MKGRRLLPGATAALTLAGCAIVTPQQGFRDVQQTVAARTGGQHVRWQMGTDADAAVAARVQELLRQDLTPAAAIQIALLNNPRLQATYESLSLAQADLVEAGLLKNPVFDGNLRFSTHGGGTGLELALIQDFVDLLYIPLRTRLAEAALVRAKLEVAGAVIDLAGEVRVACVDLQAALQTQELRQQVVAATEASYEVARRLRAAGNIRQLDLDTQRALYEQSKVDLRSVELQVLRGRERLNVLMGLWGDQTRWNMPIRLPEIAGEEVSRDGLERRAIERSLDLGAARQQVIVSGRTLGIAQPLALLSELELGADADREQDGGWGVGPALSLSIPLFNQGQPAVARAQAQLRRSRQIYAATAIRLRSQVRAAHAAVIATREKAVYYSQVLLPLRQRIVDESQLQYNAMQIGVFQLLQARQEQIQAGHEYVRALRDYWLARAELDQILSGRMSSFNPTDGETESTTSPAASGRGGH